MYLHLRVSATNYLQDCCTSCGPSRQAHAAAPWLHRVSIQAEPRAYVNDISLVCIIPPNSVAYFVSFGVHRYNVHQSSIELEIGDLLVRDEAYRRELRIAF